MNAPETPAEVDWVRRLEAARAGSSEAVGKLFEACRQYLILIANQEVDAPLAVKISPSDLVQETFLKAHREFPQFGGHSEAALHHWLRRILLNAMGDATRRFQADKRDLAREVPSAGAGKQAPAAGASPSSVVSAREQDDLLQDAIARLPAERQQVILWRNYDRLPFEEIGRRLGRSAEAARKLWARALEELQALLEPPHGANG
jgi:RNA polymerase sigma-70 factor (ECF subfamily)